MIDAFTNMGNSILELSKNNEVLLVFLRHFGCNFCKETLNEIETNKERLLNSKCKIIIVHQSSREHAKKVFEIYNLEEIEHVSDPSRIVYKAFGLGKHNYLEILKPRVLWSTFKSILKGHLPGRIKGDPLQMPGIFIIKNSVLINSFDYSNIADRPPLLNLAS